MKYEQPDIIMDEELRLAAKTIDRMLEISKQQDYNLFYFNICFFYHFSPLNRKNICANVITSSAVSYYTAQVFSS